MDVMFMNKHRFNCSIIKLKNCSKGSIQVPLCSVTYDSLTLSLSESVFET